MNADDLKTAAWILVAGCVIHNGDHARRGLDGIREGVILAGTDRIAVDAVGVAILRHFGTTPEVSRGTIFEQEQIARAVELGLGIEADEELAPRAVRHGVLAGHRQRAGQPEYHRDHRENVCR